MLPTPDMAAQIRMLAGCKWSKRVGREGSLAGRIMLGMYPDRTVTAGEIDLSSHKYRMLARLRRGEIVERVGTHAGAGYRLTLWGRCRVLSVRMGMSFLGLCMLSDAYVTHRRQIRDGTRVSYVTAEIMRLFEEVYDERHVRNTICAMLSRRLATRLSHGMIRLEGQTMDVLSEHEETVDDLHTWVVGVPRLVTEISVMDPDLLRRIRGW